MDRAALVGKFASFIDDPLALHAFEHLVDVAGPEMLDRLMRMDILDAKVHPSRGDPYLHVRCGECGDDMWTPLAHPRARCERCRDEEVHPGYNAAGRLVLRSDRQYEGGHPFPEWGGHAWNPQDVLPPV